MAWIPMQIKPRKYLTQEELKHQHIVKHDRDLATKRMIERQIEKLKTLDKSTYNQVAGTERQSGFIDTNIDVAWRGEMLKSRQRGRLNYLQRTEAIIYLESHGRHAEAANIRKTRDEEIAKEEEWDKKKERMHRYASQPLDKEVEF